MAEFLAAEYEVAGVSAVTYATIAEADAFVGWRGSDAWTNASDDTKQGVLKAAARRIDELKYEYRKSDNDQAMRFPTIQNYDDGSYYVPDRVKEAQSLLALYMLENPDLMSGTGNVASVGVPGGFSVTYREGTGNVPWPEDVMLLLDRYLWRFGPVRREYDSARRGYV